MALVKNIKETVTGLDIYNAIRNDEVSSEFRERIPEGTLTNLKDVAAAMEQYTPSYNEFMDALINRIGLTILNYRMWSNPLSQFKRKLEYGQTIQEIQTDLIKAVALNFKNENNPFAKNIPDTKVVYHNVDKQNTYIVTINEDQVRTAFLSWDGIKQLTDSVITTLYTSYYWDDYLCCREVLVNACEKKKGYLVSCPYVGDKGEDAAKQFTRAVKTYARKLKYLSKLYNASGINTFTPPENLVLFIDPEVSQNIDVNVLSAAFQLAYAKIGFTIIEVDELPYGVSGILCDAEFLRIYNYTERMTSLFNPKDLSTNYFLNVRNVYSSSILKNCVIFADPAKYSFKIEPTEASVTGTSGGSVNFTTTVEYGPGVVFDDPVPTYSVTPTKAGVTIDADSGILTFDPAAATTGETYTVRATSSLDPAVFVEAVVTVK